MAASPNQVGGHEAFARDHVVAWQAFARDHVVAWQPHPIK